ncbi:MAG: SCO family protein [Gammaproteobacteria bacterium]|nr:SCO family protein [Gammaproteobacteria bacterium]MBU2676454.1 SCO family protein [Gammaproteobacteria bacterium]NNC57928.1 SCO family protein [Woeseiaceae bacterium]NNL50189.1 SCO family protein [Woeseiaceae bacterium]
MGPRNFIVAIVLATALSAGIFVATRLQAPATLNIGFVLPAPTPLPEFALLDQSGVAITRDAFRGHWNLVFFGFTHCPDICPATLQILAAARRELQAAGQDPLPRIALVSVDPERDSPELIGQYIDNFGDNNLGITGNLEELTKLASGLGIYFEKQAGEGGAYSVDHTAAVLLVNPDAEFHALFSGPHRVENYVHDLPLIMAGS